MSDQWATHRERLPRLLPELEEHFPEGERFLR